jgi:hypothetical protein
MAAGRCGALSLAPSGNQHGSKQQRQGGNTDRDQDELEKRGHAELPRPGNELLGRPDPVLLDRGGKRTLLILGIDDTEERGRRRFEAIPGRRLPPGRFF